MDVLVRGSEGTDQPTGYSGFPEVYHLDQQCRYLRSARTQTTNPGVTDRRISIESAVYAGWRPCSTCAEARVPPMLRPLVLFEAIRTMGGRHDDWQDITGIQYHYPNQYRNKVIPGRPFIYYSGTRREVGREAAVYFGHGRIGEVRRDEGVPANDQKKDWKWFCDIEDYAAFSKPVASRREDGTTYESLKPNQWGVGVRDLPMPVYMEILKVAGRSRLQPEAPAPPIDEVVTQVVKNGLLARPPSTKQGTGRGSDRRSQRAREVGDRGEEIVFRLLKDHKPRWLAAMGETPGWDIEYRQAGLLHAVEVKSTATPRMLSLEFTANEWAAAEQLRSQYWLYVVTDCMSRSPRVQAIRDPWGMMQAGSALATPTVWRFELVPGE